jgi:LmbE family N-acetylglucosaminyl deacetylase
LDLAIVSVGKSDGILGFQPGMPFVDRDSREKPIGNSYPMALSIEEMICAHDLIVIAAGDDCTIEDLNWVREPIHENAPASIVRLHKNPTIVYQGTSNDWNDPNEYKVEQPCIDIVDWDSHPKGSVLFFCPHPDDASISAGGTLGSWNGNQKPTVVAMTSGHRAEQESASRESRHSCRMEELQRECEDLSVDLLVPELKFYDENRFFSSEDVSVLLDILRRHRPEICMIPHLDDRHPTHRSCSYMVREAIRIALKTGWLRTLEVWEYEGPWFLHTPETINLVVSLAEEAMERKLRAVRQHRSQIRRTAYDDGAEGLARYRAVTLPELCLADFGSKREIGEYVEVFRRSVWSI